MTYLFLFSICGIVYEWYNVGKERNEVSCV